MADDHASAPRPEFDIDTDEGLEAYVRDLETRRPIPERLRYPETPEAYASAIAEARADIEAGRIISGGRLRAWVNSLGSSNPLPPPECD